MTSRLLAVALTASLAAFVACGGGGSGGGGDVTTTPDVATGADGAVVTPGERVEPTWQLLSGVDTNGASYDQEGVLGLGVTADGTLVALVDRRFSDDSFGPRLQLVRVDADGELLGVTVVDFGRNTQVDGFAVRPNGHVVLAVEAGAVVELDADGALVWARELNREPYAFGGLDVNAVALDDAGDVYLAGAFSPSEGGGGERGFAARLGATGELQWMRSWNHAVFVERQQIAVGPAGVFVADELPAEQEIGSRFALFAFGPSGATLAKQALMLPNTTPRAGAVSRGALLADPAGVTLIGTRSVGTDEQFAVLAYRIAFDATLTPVSRGGTRVAYPSAEFPRSVGATRGSDGAIHAALRLADGYALLRYPAGAMAAEAYELVRDDGESPVVVDEDHPLRLAPGPDGSVYLGAPAYATGPIAFEPRASEALALPLDLEDVTVEVFEDVVTADASSIAVTASVVEVPAGEERDGDEDLLLFRATFGVGGAAP